MEKINKKLKAIYTILLSNLNVLILASVHTALTVYSDKTFFYGSAREHVLTIVFAKLIVFLQERIKKYMRFFHILCHMVFSY